MSYLQRSIHRVSVHAFTDRWLLWELFHLLLRRHKIVSLKSQKMRSTRWALLPYECSGRLFQEMREFHECTLACVYAFEWDGTSEHKLNAESLCGTRFSALRGLDFGMLHHFLSWITRTMSVTKDVDIIAFGLPLLLFRMLTTNTPTVDCGNWRAQTVDHPIVLLELTAFQHGEWPMSYLFNWNSQFLFSNDKLLWAEPLHRTCHELTFINWESFVIIRSLTVSSFRNGTRFVTNQMPWVAATLAENRSLFLIQNVGGWMDIALERFEWYWCFEVMRLLPIDVFKRKTTTGKNKGVPFRTGFTRICQKPGSNPVSHCYLSNNPLKQETLLVLYSLWNSETSFRVERSICAQAASASDCERKLIIIIIIIAVSVPWHRRKWANTAAAV